MAQYFGKYRGTVLDNADPMKIGRVRAKVPDVPAATAWAMPCVPFAARHAGLFAVPPIGAGVWIEFERGDPAHPIWTGGFWNSAAELPAPPALPGQSIVLQTAEQNALVISDAPGPAGGIVLKSTTGAMISISNVGITIANGQGATIVLLGPTVDVNEGALTVV
jgi:uncharacterized protein involved in type VI secretion and phage assembly